METPSPSSSASSSPSHSPIILPQNYDINSGGRGSTSTIHQRTQPTQNVGTFSIFPLEILTYITQHVEDPTSLFRLSVTCNTFKTIVEESCKQEYTQFINSNTPVLHKNFYARLKINKKLSATLPAPYTDEWRTLKAHPLDIKLQGEAHQIALIKQVYIRAWDLLLQPEGLNNQSLASNLMRLLLDLLPHIIYPENYTEKLFNHGLSWEIFEQLAHIHLDLCLQVVSKCFDFIHPNPAYEFIVKWCPKDFIGDLRQMREIKNSYHSFLFLALKKFSLYSYEENKYKAWVEFFQKLLAQGDIEDTDQDGKTILMYALDNASATKSLTLVRDSNISFTEENFYGLIKFLLEKGANYNTQDKRGNTPLLTACANKLDAAISLLINQPGIDVNALPLKEYIPPHHFDESFGALHYAIKNKDVVLAQKLLNLGINFAIRISAFKYAYQEKNIEMVKVILQQTHGREGRKKFLEQVIESALNKRNQIHIGLGLKQDLEKLEGGMRERE